MESLRVPGKYLQNTNEKETVNKVRWKTEKKEITV
jgi:hypothetical protein